VNTRVLITPLLLLPILGCAPIGGNAVRSWNRSVQQMTPEQERQVQEKRDEIAREHAAKKQADKTMRDFNSRVNQKSRE